MFRSECSDLLQGEDEASMKHLSLYSLASHQVLSLDLSVGATGLWLDTLPVFFNAAIQHLGSSRPPFLLILQTSTPRVQRDLAGGLVDRVTFKQHNGKRLLLLTHV